MAWDDIDADPRAASPLPDDDDIDEMAIERALARDGVGFSHLTVAEQAEVVRVLTARGVSLIGMADQLTTTARTVSRRRATLRAVL
jgi:hypothetical protein